MRAWFAAADGLEDRVERTLAAALEVGRPNLEGTARALLLDASLGTPLERAEAAVRLAPDLPAARSALGAALWSEKRDPVGALGQVWQAIRASDRHLEASLWLRATFFHALVTACLIGGLLFLFVAGGNVAATLARVLGELLGSMPLVSRAALVAGLLLIPAVLGEGLFGVALAFAALGLWRASSWQRVAVGIALVVSVAGLHPLADRAAEELVALGSDPVAEAVFAVEHGQPSRTDIDRLERAAAGDPLVGRALALHARRRGDLKDADRRFTALIHQSDTPSPRLLNNAANVRLALDRTEEAIELYEAAAHRSRLVAVLFNLSQAYGRAIRLDHQDLALEEAQFIDPAAIGVLSDLYASSSRALVADLPVETAAIRVRLGDPAAARQAASALRRRFAPGWLGASPIHSAVGVALALLASLGGTLALRRTAEAGDGGDLYAGMARLLTGREAADPFLRMVRLAELRERQARIEKIRFLFSLIVPGAAGILSRHPILGLLGSMLFGLCLASWWARDGVVADPLAVGASASLLFGAFAVALALAYVAVIAVTVAMRERS
jgi:tetratricopeptide (TPR) repeat protein